MRMIRLHAVVFVLVVFATAVRAQTLAPPLAGEPFRDAGPFASARIAALRKQVDAKTPDAVDRFWFDVRASGAPLVEPVPNEKNYSFVTFVWRGSDAAHNVVVVDGVAVAVGGVLPVNSETTRLGGTDVWYRTYKVRNDARFVYKMSENDPLTSFVDPSRKSNATIDPLNPRVFPTQQSFVELPAAASQEIALHPSDTPGKVEQKKFHSTTLNNDRDLWIYTPRNFHADGARYPLAVVLDGRPYTTWVPVPTILDNLIQQKRIPPMVAVMVGALNREVEQSCSTAFAEFLSNELVPWMRANYNVTADPKLTVIAGSSRGGLASSCAAYQHPNVFGKVLSQSGSYWWKPDNDQNPEWLTAQFAHSPYLPLQFTWRSA
jgi:enterochelin esterase-like enzyme